MRRFVPDEIKTFLQAVDKHLTKPFRIDVIGAAAAALSYGSVKGTMDIDTTGSVEEIRAACKKAGEETGLQIPVQHAAVFDGPYDYETRMQEVKLPGIKRLQIHVPEKHDWALMKIVRLHEKDIEDIKAAADRGKFDPEVFLARFVDEMSHVHGPRKRLVDNFLAMMEELYGTEASDRMEQTIRDHPKWRGVLR